MSVEILKNCSQLYNKFHLMTLSDLQGHSPIASLFTWDFSYSCAAVFYVIAELPVLVWITV